MRHPPRNLVSSRRHRWAGAALVVVLAAGAAQPARAQTVRPPPPAPLRLPLAASEGMLTPTTFRVAYPLMTLVYDTLMWRDAGGVARPWLARSIRVRGDGRTIDVRLRRGVRWHDGRPLTASDVAFTFAFFARRPHPRFTPQLRAITRVTARGGQEVRFTLARRSPGFVDQPLADVPILPRHLWRDLSPGRLAPAGRAIGSGPYRLSGRRPDGGYSLVANSAYFRARPAPRRIEVPVIRDAARTLRRLRAGALDMVPVALGAAQRDRVRQLGIRFVDGPSYSGTMLVLNTRRAPLRTAAARRALARTLDLERIARTAGDAVPADHGFVDPRSRWAPRDVLHRFVAGPAAGSLRRRRLGVLVADNDPQRREAGRQVVLALRRAGMRARLIERSAGAVARAVGRDGSSPDYELAVLAIPSLASYDPDFLHAIFGRTRGVAPLADTGYSSATFERAAARTATRPGRATRLRAVRDELRVLAREVPAVALVYPVASFALRPAAHDGWVFVAGSGILDKQSFLPRPAAAAAPPVTAEPAADEDDGDPLAGAAFVLLGLAGAIVAGAALLRVLRRR